MASSNDKPKLQRAGTMQATAKEGIAFCVKGGLDWCEGGFVEPEDENLTKPTVESVQEKEEESEGPNETEPVETLKRQSTMAATAKEGTEFLRRSQGSAIQDGSSPESSSKKSRLQRDSTIDVTAREGREFIERMGGVVEDEPADEKDSAVKTVAFTKDVDKVASERGSRPKLQRDSTIDITVKEAAEFLNRSGGVEEEDKKEKTDEKMEEKREEVEEQDEGDVAPPQLRRDLTMKETAKIGEEFIGEQLLTESRNQTRLLRESEMHEPRKPRRASLKRAGTMDVTAAEGEEFVKRSKK